MRLDCDANTSSGRKMRARGSAALLLATALLGPFAPLAYASTPAEVAAALPPLEGMRLTAFQAQLLGRTQRQLHALNPSRIGEVENLLTANNLCFREIARRAVAAGYSKSVAQLSPEERDDVALHLRQPGAAAILALEEGSSGRLDLQSGSSALETAALPGVQRFFGLARRFARRIALTETGPLCQMDMKRDFVARGLVFVPEIGA